MADEGPSDYVLKHDEEDGVPMCIYWTTEQVADWICDIGYPQYRACIETNFVTGRHFILLDANHLPKMGIYDFEHIKDIAGKIREMLGLDHIIKDMIVSMADPMIAYIEMKRRTGIVADNIPFVGFLKMYRRWY